MVDEDTLRDRVATCTRILTMKGLIGIYGHVSAFDPESGRVFVSPGAGSDRANTAPGDLFVWDLNNNMLEGRGPIPAEWPIHTAIHATRKDALAVAHVHAPYTTLFSIAKREFAPVTLTGMRLGVGLPMYQGRGLVSTPDLGQKLAEDLGLHVAVLMRGHGATVVGTSLEDVMMSCLVLEDNCVKTYQAAVLGDVMTFTDEECKTAGRFGAPGGRPLGEPEKLSRSWQYYARMEARWNRQPEQSGYPLN